MQYWLFKSEPSAWSWQEQVARGDAGEQWDGVRNYQARNVMRQMALGDRGFFYHSQAERAIVGIVEICAEAHPDTTTDDPRWDCVDIRAVMPVEAPVTLDAIKADPRLADMPLVRQPRLSVQPVSAEAWRIICDMAGVDPSS
ncbi:EVE domain-containing protein [Roseovarius nanhaiticus]|nr:EVE domain-containing protein [Roseovarius nanhaiticus]